MTIPERPENCTCEFPKIRYRNMIGHHPTCPVYIEWKAQTKLVPEGESIIPTKPTLPPFNEKATCPKCGFGDIWVWYCDKVDSTKTCHKHIGDQVLRDTEHLHRVCKRCRYMWCEGCIDAFRGKPSINTSFYIQRPESDEAAAEMAKIFEEALGRIIND